MSSACAEKSEHANKLTEALYMISQAKKQLFKNGLLFVVLMADVIFSGCSTTNPSAESGPVAPSQNSEAAAKGLSKAPVSQSSSLEQLQQGKPVGTAASSPLKDIYFDYDRYDVRADTRDVLKSHAEWLKQNPASSVQIEGHCDDRGYGGI
jgi:peptidoglycan-associated lipoprotein